MQLCKISILVLLCVISLSSCKQNDISDTQNSVQQKKSSDVTNNEELKEDNEMVAANFKIGKEELITKIESSSKFKKSTDTNETCIKYIYRDGNVELDLLQKDNTDNFNTLSIIDRNSKEQNYKIVYKDLLGFLGISANVEELEKIGEEQVQVSDVWVKCYSEANEKTIIINSYQE
ncbi:hypothetical protein [Anaerosacchariphilus polymeriproducens]|uniref:Lipoprotein n=1 Tax=Anaerosacchariphilus polymeriproducens TaxID=1812858 RepID=A0A371AQI9_9FIRM|nr:hypothetical protein [Anaerosacchariphilus polymeriproducens]RDU21827.1 hypothetical protein DWV06_17745 [Anaerosacchariphilus polymeriproducens]